MPPTYASRILLYFLTDSSFSIRWKHFSFLISPLTSYSCRIPAISYTYVLGVVRCGSRHRPHITLIHTQLCSVLQSPFSINCTFVCCSHLRPQIFFQMFCGRSLPLWSCGIHWSACLAMLSSHLLIVRPSQVHFLRRIWFSTGSRLVVLHNCFLHHIT